MEVLSTKDEFLQSLERCGQNEGFMPMFYARFNSSSDLVKERFQKTNFEQQNSKMMSCLRMVAGVSNNEAEALCELRKRAQTHGPEHLNISPELFELWHRTLVSVVAEVDPHWNEGLKKTWDTTLHSVTAHMIKNR